MSDNPQGQQSQTAPAGTENTVSISAAELDQLRSKAARADKIDEQARQEGYNDAEELMDGYIIHRYDESASAQSSQGNNQTHQQSTPAPQQGGQQSNQQGQPPRQSQQNGGQNMTIDVRNPQPDPVQQELMRSRLDNAYAIYMGEVEKAERVSRADLDKLVFGPQKALAFDLALSDPECGGSVYVAAHKIISNRKAVEKQKEQSAGTQQALENAAGQAEPPKGSAPPAPTQNRNQQGDDKPAEEQLADHLFPEAGVYREGDE